ncbi:MAG: SprB repeat-containing protein [Prolixibacteraceae bacterium]|nr:SprB repeat-containing protein [Prolixibacteraceae bacterium]
MKQALNIITQYFDRIPRAKTLLALPLLMLVLLMLPEKGWGQTYDHTGEPLTGPAPGLSSSYVISCEGEFTIEYSINISGGTGGYAELQYSPDNINWISVGTSIASIDIDHEVNSNLYLQVYVNDLTHGSSVELILTNVEENEDLRINEVSHTDNTCHGTNTDGEIEVAAACGTGSYTYSWGYSGDYSFSPPGNVSLASGLYAGSYTITVDDGDNIEQITIPITEPDELTIVSVTGASNFCSNNSGEFTVQVSGGTPDPDYTVTISRTGYSDSKTDPNGPFTFSSLGAGEYTITLEDDCGASKQETFEVRIDTDDPTFSYFPPDYFITVADYENDDDYLEEDVPVYTNATNYNCNGPITDEFSYFDIDLSHYTNARMELDFTQSGTPPTAGDIIRISRSFDGSNFDILNEYTAYTGIIIEEALNLNSNPVENTKVTVKVEVILVTSGLTYNFTEFRIIADERFSTIGPGVSGFPSCADDISGCNGSPSYIDSEPIWVCYETATEFYVEREWTITDNCDRTSSQTQLIKVGELPVIDMSANTAITSDFCNNDLAITAPTVTDNCSATGDIDIEWVITDDETIPNVLETGVGDISYTFPVGETSIITWTAIDETENTNSATQNVTILDPIDISISHVGDGNLCSDEENTFNITITGGTDNYDTGSLSIIPSSGNTVDANGEGQFTSSITWVNGTSETITININDSDGCPSGSFEFTSGDGIFTVHQLIGTNPLNRVD